MSGSFTAWFETQLLGHGFSGIPYTPPAVEYVALFTTAPNYTGAAGVEAAGGAYVREPVLWSAPIGTPPYVQNTVAIEWPCATATWGTVVAVAIFDAATAGNMLASALLVDPGDMTTPRPALIEQGGIFRIEIAKLRAGFVTPPPAGARMGARSRVLVAAA